MAGDRPEFSRKQLSTFGQAQPGAGRCEGSTWGAPVSYWWLGPVTPLTPGGSFTAGGTTLTWPDVPAGDPDMIHADGQKVAVSGSGSTLVIVGASHNGS